MMDQQVQLDQSLNILKECGAPVEPAQEKASYSCDINIGVLMQWSQALNNFSGNESCAPCDATSPIPELDGVACGVPSAAFQAAAVAQGEQHSCMENMATSAQQCVEMLNQVLNQCSATVNQISTATQGFCDAVRATLAGPECEVILRAVLNQAASAADRLLGFRNSCLESICDQSIADTQPAQAVVEGKPAPATVMPAQAVAGSGFAGVGALAVAGGLAAVGGLATAGTAVAESGLAGTGLAGAGVSSAGACPPLFDAQWLETTVRDHIGQSAHAWNQFVEGVQNAMCPSADEIVQHVSTAECPSAEQPQPETCPEAAVPAADTTDCAPEPEGAEDLQPESVPSQVDHIEQVPAESGTAGSGSSAEFDKTQHPSYPAQAPVDPPESAQAVPAAPDPAPAANVPTVDQSWSPDIWMDLHAEGHVSVEGSTSESAGSAVDLSSEPVELAMVGPDSGSAGVMGSVGGSISGSSAGIALERSEQW